MIRARNYHLFSKRKNGSGPKRPDPYMDHIRTLSVIDNVITILTTLSNYANSEKYLIVLTI